MHSTIEFVHNGNGFTIEYLPNHVILVKLFENNRCYATIVVNDAHNGAHFENIHETFSNVEDFDD